MTMVFHAHSLGVPILVGDMLVSGAEPEDYGDLKLPDHFEGVDQVFPKGSGFVPLRLKRKLFIINNDLALGLSGSVLHMRVFLSDLEQRNAAQQINTSVALRTFVDEYAACPEGSDILSHINALLVLQEDENTHFCVAGAKARESCSETDTDNLGHVVAIGSGADSITEEANRFDSYSLNYPSENVNSIGRIFPALTRALALISQLHQIDALSANFLLQLWGGAFELIYHDGDGFRFLNEYTLIFWNLDLESEDKNLNPLGIRKYERGTSHSIVHCYQSGQFLAFGASDVNTGTQKSISIDLRTVSFNSEIMSNLVLATRNGRIQNIYNFVDKHTEDYPGAVFAELDKEMNLGIYLQSELGQKLADHFIQTQKRLEKT